jgi:hypothetical protein
MSSSQEEDGRSRSPPENCPIQSFGAGEKVPIPARKNNTLNQLELLSV